MSNTTMSMPLNDGWPIGRIKYRALDATFFLSALAILSTFTSKRAPPSWAQFKALSLSRWLVFCVLVDSWLFIYVSGVIVLGVGTSSSEAACATGIWWCIILYASSKVFIYVWLMERVHIVWTTHGVGSSDDSSSGGAAPHTSRFKSRAYRISAVFGLLWIAVFISMIVGRISFLRSTDGQCVVGLKLFATIPMIVVDALVNLYLTTAFVIPIWKSKFTTAHKLAFRSSIASMAALITSAVNIVILTVLHGHQLPWVCLMSCGLDVTLNAVILFLVTSDSNNSRNPSRRKSFRSNFGASIPFDKAPGAVFGSTSEVGISLGSALKKPGASLAFPGRPKTADAPVLLGENQVEDQARRRSSDYSEWEKGETAEHGIEFLEEKDRAQ